MSFLLKNILWLGVPWLTDKLGFSTTKTFAVIAAGAAAFLAFAGFGPLSVAVLAWAGSGAVFSLREAWERIKPYIPILDKFFEQYTGYADLDKVAEAFDKWLAEAK